MPERRSSRTPPATTGRSFWSGTITFGLVSIPVDLFSASRARRKSMRMVDTEGHPLGRRYYCPKHEQILEADELVRGYETDSGKMVVITDEEFASAAPEKSRDIDLRSFVALKDIPSRFFERPYFLAPGERAGKAYSLLAQTMTRTGKAGIGSFVMRSHEYLVAILADGGILRAEVLRYGDELRSPESIGLPKAPSKPKPSLVRELTREIDGLGEKALDLHEMDDLEAEALREFAERKAKAGKGVIAMEAPEEDDEDSDGGAEVVDLMALLKKSLGGKTTAPARKGGARKPAAREPADKKSGKKPSAKKPPAKKPAGKKPAAKKPLAKKAGTKTHASRKATAATNSRTRKTA